VIYRDNSILNMAKSLYASTRNKQPIIEVFQGVVEKARVAGGKVNIFEIASGTGEHAAFFGERLNNIVFQPSEPQIEMHDSILDWTKALCGIVLPPILLNIEEFQDDAILPEYMRNQSVDIIICINMIHISPFSATESLFRTANACIRSGGYVYLYGPYRVGGYMGEGNSKFDAELRERNPSYGIRDLEDVERVAKTNFFALDMTVDMPSNNLSVIFKKFS